MTVTAPADPRDVIELAEPPVLWRLYARAAAMALRRSGDRLPSTVVRVDDVPIDADHVATYDRACGFRLTDEVPPTYPHLVAFPLAVHLMSSPGFPFALPGLVHIANRITQNRPVTVSDRVSAEVSLGNLRPHRRGRQFDINAVVSVAGDAAWTSTSTYLHREKTPPGGSAKDDRSRDDQDGGDLPTATTAIWRLPADAGRRYAAVSGDRNPIHMSSLSARLFGFPRTVAHGMWSKARCLAALQRAIPDGAPITVEFAKPVLLPGTVALCADVDDATSFALRSRDGRSLHLSGRIGRG